MPFQKESSRYSIEIEPRPCGLSAATQWFIGLTPKIVKRTMNTVAIGESIPTVSAAMPGMYPRVICNVDGPHGTIGRMNAYSEDLRKKIIEALRRGATKSEAARAFGVSRSSVKRYAKLVEEGRPLAPRKRPGSKPKMDEGATKLLEADVERRPAATLSERCEFLEKVAGLQVSESTLSRMLRRLGWSRKKGRWVRANATSS